MPARPSSRRSSSRAWPVRVIMWEAVKFVLDDPLYAGSFGIANFSYVLMGVALGVRRRSMRGQVPAIWAGYLLLVVCWSTANFLWFPDAFREPQWVILHLGSFLGGIGLLYASIRWPGTEAEAPVREEAQAVHA